MIGLAEALSISNPALRGHLNRHFQAACQHSSYTLQMNTSDNKSPAQLIVHPAWILPIIPREKVLTDVSLVVREGRIAELLPTEDALQMDATEHLSLPHSVLMPGLVNSHGHSPMTLLRGIADDAPLQSWLEEHIWPLEAEFVSEQFVRDGTDLALAELLLGGTTTFSDMYFFPEITAQRIEAAGLRAQLVFPIIDVATAWAQDSDSCLDKGLTLRDHYRDHELIEVGFGIHATYSVTESTLKKVATLTHELDAAMQIHLHETPAEVEAGLKAHGERPLDLLNRIGLLGPRSQCVHMTTLSERDIASLADSNSHVVHCPRSNMKLASGICPVHRLHQAGINVALGTDGAASNNRLSMLAELQTAALLAKLESPDASALPATAALEIATIGGARALGMEADIGSLEVGKSADMIALDLSGLSTQPVNQVLSQIVYATSGTELTHSWVGGRCLVNNGQLLTLDATEIRGRASLWPGRFKASQIHQ